VEDDDDSSVEDDAAEILLAVGVSMLLVLMIAVAVYVWRLKRAAKAYIEIPEYHAFTETTFVDSNNFSREFVKIFDDF
jgi:hypothetical protein